MLQGSPAFSGFSVDNLEAARKFYSDTLGLQLAASGPGFELQFPNGQHTLVYPKPDHQPATFTVLNFPVDDIDIVITGLLAKGIQFIHYDDPHMPQDAQGILRGKSVNMGPDIAWFKDPAGNILAILES